MTAFFWLVVFTAAVFLASTEGTLRYMGVFGSIKPSVSTSDPPSIPPDAKVLNEVMDILLEDFVREYGDQYDPLILTPGTQVTPRIRVLRGALFGLSSLRRDGDCYVWFDEGDAFVAALNLQVSDLAAIVRFKASLVADVGPTLDAWVKVGGSRVHMVLNTTVDDETRVQSLKIVELQNVEVSVAGLGALDVPLNKVVRAMVRLTADKLKEVLEVRVRHFAAELLSNIDIPFLFGLR